MHRTKTCPECQEFQTPVPERFRLMWKMLNGSRSKEIWDRSTPARTRAPSEEQRIEGLHKRSARTLERLGSQTISDIHLGKWIRLPDPDELEFPRWSASCTLFDPVDREFGAPPRIHVNSPKWHWIIALGPHGKVAKGIADQEFLRGYIHRRPQHHRVCRNVTRLFYEENIGPVRYIICPLIRGHKGCCYDWEEKKYVSSPSVETKMTFS